MWYEGKYWQVSRLVWTLINGDIPKGLHVLHTCDNPPCARPEHLFLGTRQDNSDDMKQKGRQVKRKGELNPAAKLTPEIVIGIRNSVLKRAQLAEHCKVSIIQIDNIRAFRKWSHL